MVGGTGLALVGIHTGHKVGLRMLGQLCHDMHTLVVLALGVDNVDGLVFADQHALVAHLATHLTIERSGIEHQLVEGVLLLLHLTVAQDVALVLSIVVTHKLLLALAQLNPVAILHCSGIAGTLFLLLHLHMELLLIDGVAMLTADELGQVEWEAISIEQTEGSLTVELCLFVGHQLVHGAIQQLYTLVECTQEGVLLFFHHTADEHLLGL